MEQTPDSTIKVEREALCTRHDPKANGECSICGAHCDLPTLPLRVRQTPGGYKAIEDAEGRHVAFIGMREDDGSWGEFLAKRTNSYDALREAAQAALTRLEIKHDLTMALRAKGDTLAVIPEAERALIKQLRAALSLVDVQATEEGNNE